MRFHVVGGLEHFLLFHILGIVTPTDFHMFQDGYRTTNQIISWWVPNVLRFCLEFPKQIRVSDPHFLGR